eukprot:2261198-Pyramimonas_sp.AAC.1
MIPRRIQLWQRWPTQPPTSAQTNHGSDFDGFTKDHEAHPVVATTVKPTTNKRSNKPRCRLCPVNGAALAVALWAPAPNETGADARPCEKSKHSRSPTGVLAASGPSTACLLRHGPGTRRSYNARV